MWLHFWWFWDLLMIILSHIASVDHDDSQFSGRSRWFPRDISYFDFTCLLSYRIDTYLMYSVMRNRRARADPVDRKSSKFVSWYGNEPMTGTALAKIICEKRGHVFSRHDRKHIDQAYIPLCCTAVGWHISLKKKTSEAGYNLHNFQLLGNKLPQSGRIL